MKPNRTYYLCLDFERATITRYVHHRGAWGVRHLRTVALDPPEGMAVLGQMLLELETFRKTGDV
jgi:hypothetical protein